MAEGAPLSVPKPDLSFGLRPEESAHSTASDLPHLASVLSEDFLEAARIRLGLHPWPSPSLPEVAFPCLVFEAKSDSSALFFAENQATGGAAKALSMLHGLQQCFEESDGGKPSGLPVLVWCTQGSLWEFLIAYRHITTEGDKQTVSFLENYTLIVFVVRDLYLHVS